MKTRQQLIAFIENQRLAYIGSVDEAGFPNIKAMYAPRMIKGDSLYFTTNLSALRTRQFAQEPRASVYFCERGRFRYAGLMLLGEMQVCTDDETKQAVWRDGDERYYKGGPTDPDYCVLCFTAQKARYYSNFKTIEFDLTALQDAPS